MGPGMNDYVKALSAYNDEVIAGGWFTTAGGNPANSIARWDGAQWHPMGAGFEAAVFALTVYDDELIAGGWFGPSPFTTLNFIARWAVP